MSERRGSIGGVLPATPAPLLVRRPAPPGPEPEWDAAGRRVLAHAGGFLRVLGGPGTGKTTLLAQVAADRIARRGVDPENVLVLTANRRAASAMRAHVTALLTAANPDRADGDHLRTVRQPLVRTVHSYAFGVLRLQAALHGEPPPKLLSGPEQDAVVRDLLLGDAEMGADYWPERLRPALTLPGFAEELRDLLLRAAERGLGPEDLIELGRRHERDEWVAAGRFFQTYEQVTLLRGAGGPQATAPALDAAELIASALLALDVDPELLAAERARVRLLLVDDAQHLDPQAHELVRRLGEAAGEFVLAGDPDQSVFGFRGADPGRLVDADPTGERTAVLTVDRRMAPAVRSVVRRLAARLPGAGRQRSLAGPEGEAEELTALAGQVQVRLLASAAQEASWVADQLRRAHLLDGVPWSEMAVLVRSTTHTLPVLRRALLAAGVPVMVPADHVPLARQSAVWPLLTLLRVAARPEELDQDTAAALLVSPLGGADALALRRLRRGLRRLELAAGGERSSGELLVEVLTSDERLAALDDTEAEPARQLAGLWRTAREALAEGAGVEQVLWAVWQASGLERRWVAQSARGGTAGAQADRDLDAVVALFDAAARYADALPGASVTGFAEHLSVQQISGDSLAPAAPRDDAVAVLTAHAAAGREWTVVAVPGVQEGVWPDLRSRGSLLGVERLVDVLAGVAVDETVSATAPLLAEERRLLLVAASRARRTLLVSAVRGEDEQPSRFLDELDGAATDPDAVARPVFRPERGLVLAELVGELRRAVCDQDADPARRRRAARQLARLAAAGVPGAHPDTWYGLPDVSTDAPLWTDDVVRVSPSAVEKLLRCPLRWLVEKHGGEDAAALASVTGSLVHAMAQAVSSGADEAEVRRALDEAWAVVDAGAPWFSRRERQRVEAMLGTFRTWLSRSRGELTQLAVEHDLNVELPAENGAAGTGDADGAGRGPRVRVRGRVDRLEVDRQGRPVVVDLKTGKTPVAKAEAEEHPQLAVYQLAAALGAYRSLGVSAEPGGARLVYVANADRSGAAKERVQSALDGERLAMWRDAVRAAAVASTGPEFDANESADCPRCVARTCCPLQPSGRQVGS
ncbi:ATP-dependent helicase [Streptoalloteichus hindustanus]|uniref:DNA 3'-5' helicase n=1 Tax=Streptoalloteichus hindustanus TaxID=2017 RepID=A0A1M5J9C3_STRHI|nr:ATP-dependent DNA helicase [Streptoalloteichus hindustanus]SHG36965.1 Superfamily I DNA or RNA helicase [Streptoalloteichus hindustanus]